MTTPTLNISDDLRKDILSWLEWQKDQGGQRASAVKKLGDEIAGHEQTLRGLDTQALQLEGEIIRDTDAAVRLTGVNSQRQAIARRIAELKQQLEQVGPPSLRSARDILGAIVTEYLEKLPGLLAEAFGPFFLREDRARQVGRLSDCHGHLRVIRQMDLEPGALLEGGNLARVKLVLENALVGRLLLLATYEK